MTDNHSTSGFMEMFISEVHLDLTMICKGKSVSVSTIYAIRKETNSQQTFIAMPNYIYPENLHLGISLNFTFDGDIPDTLGCLVTSMVLRPPYHSPCHSNWLVQTDVSIYSANWPWIVSYHRNISLQGVVFYNDQGLRGCPGSRAVHKLWAFLVWKNNNKQGISICHYDRCRWWTSY